LSTAIGLTPGGSGGKVWKKGVYDRKKWKELLRTARNCRILHMPMEWKWMNILH